jgi:uncharacterized membrane protein YgdD (TMEM256/DUF423 family)
MPLAKIMENGLRREHALIVLIAALQGAGGVTLAAVAAHGDASASLATASQFLMVHACAGLALAALAAALSTPPRGLIYATFALQAGVSLFSTDLALRALGPGRLFPYAAPIGGTTTIVSWLALALWATIRLAKTDRDRGGEGGKPALSGKNRDRRIGED